MGANSVNTMAEAISDRVAALAGGTTGLRILTNLADKRLVHVKTEIPFEGMKRGRFDGERVSEGVVAAARFAADDPYRAATHNKGIFNGVDAVLVATGNDWRAVEAGGHAYAAADGAYRPLTEWHIAGGNLVGTLTMPMAVGIVGGAARSHPVAGLSLALMGVETARELACVVGTVGLATNLAALAALASEGIQFGHMRLHARKHRK
jgi:hydroxymethylglutaryl-CoA reductase